MNGDESKIQQSRIHLELTSLKTKSTADRFHEKLPRGAPTSAPHQWEDIHQRLGLPTHAETREISEISEASEALAHSGATRSELQPTA